MANPLDGDPDGDFDVVSEGDCDDPDDDLWWFWCWSIYTEHCIDVHLGSWDSEAMEIDHIRWANPVLYWYWPCLLVLSQLLI